MKYIRSPEEIKENNRGIFEVQGTNAEIDKYLQQDLDLKEFRDYVLVTNQTVTDPWTRNVKMLHFVSDKGIARFIQWANKSKKFVVQKYFVPHLKQVQYSLWVQHPNKITKEEWSALHKECSKCGQEMENCLCGY